MDLSDSIGNGIISALAREFFSRLFNYIIENKEKIILMFKEIFNIRDHDLSNNYPNTPFTFSGKQFVAHV
jgi:hypothetical protein